MPHVLILPTILVGAAIVATAALLAWTVAELVDLGRAEFDIHVDQALDVCTDTGTADFALWEGEL